MTTAATPAMTPVLLAGSRASSRRPSRPKIAGSSASSVTMASGSGGEMELDDADLSPQRAPTSSIPAAPTEDSPTHGAAAG